MVGRKQTENVKNSIGNGVARELTWMTHGHELREWGIFFFFDGGMGGTGCRRPKGGKVGEL